MGSRVGHRTELNLAHQALVLRQLVPEGTIRLRPGLLTWIGWVQPTAQTNAYQLRIDIKSGRRPSVRVLAPALKPTDDGLLPHVYDDGTLCLTRPGEWSPTQYITETFLPWACEWLTFYELWLATGLWHGEGPDGLDTESQAAILHPYS